jgi:hypothetical protein
MYIPTDRQASQSCLDCIGSCQAWQPSLPADCRLVALRAALGQGRPRAAASVRERKEAASLGLQAPSAFTTCMVPLVGVAKAHLAEKGTSAESADGIEHRGMGDGTLPHGGTGPGR